MNQVNSWMMAESFPTQPSWTREEDKLFEHALVLIPPEDPERWRKIAGIVVGKSPVELLEHYDALVRDVREIDSGRVELPNYTDDSFMRKPESRPSQISFDSRPKQSETERKKGLSWTREEHERFLRGLKKYGKGDWRSISRNAVFTRTPTQVASHAQKYFLRRNSNKERKRSSIHDITTEDDSLSDKVQSPPNSKPLEWDWTPPTNVIPIQPLAQPIQPHYAVPSVPHCYDTVPQFFDTNCSFGYQNFGTPM